METITARNVNDAWPIGLMFLRESGVQRDSRNGPVIEYPDPVSLKYLEPTERVLFDKQRDINPFLHFFEPLWILAGQEDVEFLANIVKRFREYSDNGYIFYGAYGARLMYPEDQIRKAIELLKNNPDDRRVVLQIRRPSDMWYSGVDTPCFAGNTNLPSPEGDKTFKEVAELFSSGKTERWPVYAVNPETGDLKIQWASNVWKSGHKKTISITFDTGLVLRVTPDHVLYRRTQGRDFSKESPYANKVERIPVKAGDLKKGDSVVATGLSWVGKNNIKWVKKNIYKNTTYSNRQFVHREYYTLAYGEIPDKHVIHHTNENNQDNSLYNLDCIHESEHNCIHRIGDKNPMRNMTEEQHQLRVEKWRKSYGKTVVTRDVVNHKVVSVEEYGEEDVYDFTVPEYHNALVGDGVVAHNCNTAVACKIRDGKLNIHVFNRSNDYIWGMTGANMPQFSTLQEYLAGQIGCKVGHYHQTTDSMHVYTELNDKWDMCKFTSVMVVDPYDSGEVEPYPLFKGVDNVDDFDKDLFAFFEDGERVNFITPYFQEVVCPMWECFIAHKHNKEGKKCVDAIKATDWQLAVRNWLETREK